MWGHWTRSNPGSGGRAVVGGVPDPDRRQAHASGRGQGDLLVPLAALDVAVGDDARPGHGVAVRAARVTVRPDGRRAAVTARGDELRGLAVAGLHRRGPGGRGDRERGDAADVAPESST